MIIWLLYLFLESEAIYLQVSSKPFSTVSIVFTVVKALTPEKLIPVTVLLPHAVLDIIVDNEI